MNHPAGEFSSRGFRKACCISSDTCGGIFDTLRACRCRLWTAIIGKTVKMKETLGLISSGIGFARLLDP